MKKFLTLAVLLVLTAGAFAQAPHKYGIKCGIVKTVTDNDGRKSYTTLWFDDYGAREKSVTTMDMGGGMGEAEWITISLEDGKSYMLDNTRKAATAMARQDVNYLDMPDAVAKARKSRIIGEETIDGRKCVKWEEKVKQILHSRQAQVRHHPHRAPAAQIPPRLHLRHPRGLQDKEPVRPAAFY